MSTDVKTGDFTINGMKTGWLVLFLAYALWAHLGGALAWRHLGLAWADLMWTRPDSFIYITLMAFAVLVVGTATTKTTRRELVLCFLKAGLLTTVLYLPWFIGAWIYYGSPVPHTVVAKGGLAAPITVERIWRTLWDLFSVGWRGEVSSTGAFMPAYFQMGGWPLMLERGARILSGLTVVRCLIPGVGKLVRICSFVFLGCHLYLSVAPYFPFPWYLPAVTPFAVMAWAGLVARIWPQDDRGWRRVARGG
ncbi:MAG: hypothetical protein J6386_00950 [Candidatus Synoicihabitans palmerolidicus]|nr:hypothetical protein [Candidatus Synoicihabitans palmerolidicus]